MMEEISDYRRNLAWKAGQQACLRGQSRKTCRRQPCTIYFDDWHDGYSEAERSTKGAEGHE